MHVHLDDVSLPKRMFGGWGRKFHSLPSLSFSLRLLRHSVHSGKFEWLARATNLNCSLGSAVVAPSFKPNSSKDNSLRAAVRARNHEPGALLSACFKGGARLY